MGAIIALIFLLHVCSGMVVWQDGKEYQYRQELTMVIGTGNSAAAASGFKTRADVTIQVADNKLKVNVKNLEKAIYNTPAHAGDAHLVYHPVDDFVEAPFTISLVNGTVTGVQLSPTTPKWLQNMMKAFASSLQLNLGELSNKSHFRTMESTVHGECMSMYTLQTNDDLTVVSKSTSHLKDCVNRHYRFYNNFNGYTCNENAADKKFSKVFNPFSEEYSSSIRQSYTPTEPLYSESTSLFFMIPIQDDTYTLAKFLTHGHIIVQPFTENGPTHTSLTNMTCFLKGVYNISEKISLPELVNHDKLEYEFEDFSWDSDIDLKQKENFFHAGFFIDENQTALMQQFEQKLESFIQEKQANHHKYMTKEDIDKLHSTGINTILPFLFSLDYDTLKTVKNKYSYEADTPMGSYKRNLFVELLYIAGTNPAAILIKEMIIKDEFNTDFEAANIITQVPYHIRKPTKSLVELYEELLDITSSTKPLTNMAIPLAFGHLVRRTCELSNPQPYQTVENPMNKFSKEKKECIDKLLNPYVEKFFEKFKSASADSEDQQHNLMVLFNLRLGKVSDLLKPVVQGKTEHSKQHNVRTLAIFTVGAGLSYSGQTQEVLLPIFFDMEENHEVRLAAFDIIMRASVDSTVMAQITKYMMYPHGDSEVFNYVYTAFEKIAENNEDICNSHLREKAKFFINYWRQHRCARPSHTFGASKTYSRSFANGRYGYGGAIEMHIVGSHQSAAPLSFMFDVQSHHFGHHKLHFLGGYIRVQGLTKAVANKIRELTVFNPEQWKVDELKNLLFTQMNIRERPDVPVKIDVIYMLKDNVVFQRHYNENSVRPDGNILNFFKDFFKWSDEKIMNHQFVFNLGTILYEQPTELGVPMAYLAGITTAASFQAEISKTQESGTFFGSVDSKLNLHMHAHQSLIGFDLSENFGFKISQGRIYSQKFGNKVSGFINVPKKNLKISFSRPEYSEPHSMLMHSRTSLSVFANKLPDLVHDKLSRTCPTCEPVFTITTSGQSKKDHIFLNVNNEEWGIHAEGKTFDCEAEELSSNGQMIKLAGEAFSTVNKSPNDIVTIATMGLRDLHSFLFYFPKVESCGLTFKWSQSKFNPVDNIDIILNGDMRYISNEGRELTVTGQVIMHGHTSRKHYIDIKYAFEPFMVKNTFEMKITRQPFRLSSREFPPQSLCLDYHSRYPRDPKQEIAIDIHNDQKTRSDMTLSWGQYTNCNNNPGRIQVIAQHQTTVEARRSLEQKWYYTRCLADMKAASRGKIMALTDACLYTAMDLYRLRQFKWTVSLNELEPWMISGYKQLEILVKAGLFPFWKVEQDSSLARQAQSVLSSSINNFQPYSPIIVIEQYFHSTDETFDLTIQDTHEKNTFQGVSNDFFRWSNEPYLQLKEPFRMQSSHVSSIVLGMKKYGILNKCHATPSSILTFDNFTYPYEMHSCWTLVSSHCSPTPSYAVFMKKSSDFPNTVKMDVEIHVGGYEILVQPLAHAKFDITVEGQKITLDENEVYYWPSNQKYSTYSKNSHTNYKFKLYRSQKSVHFYSPMNVMVDTDGHYINVLVLAHVKGQHCGMCGDFNGDDHRELIHPEMCLLRDGNEMAAAWAWHQDTTSDCPAKPDCKRLFFNKY